MVNHASSNRPLTELTSKKIRKLRRPPQPALNCFESASTVADNSALLFCYSNVWKFLPWFVVNVIISWKPDLDRPSLGLQFIWTTQVQHAICKCVWFHFPVSSDLLTPHCPEVSLQLARNEWKFFSRWWASPTSCQLFKVSLKIQLMTKWWNFWLRTWKWTITIWRLQKG